ncbi:SUMF1/EgtB/PvdO family nonheme iron enzyme [Streptomyces sp. NPDC047022]|uniref:SUMF1/EgtB/PvdO family nonheme iron enzyme n=1 Tax=Streptomyces sp. NPDC047022 TaxID=3155737 RepID=UPI0033ED0544
MQERLHGSPASDNCVLLAGAYLVGPAERLLIRPVERPVRFDRHAVTVARYRRFLDALDANGTSQWDHPDQASSITHRPWTDRLRPADYYGNPRYDSHPAICVNWWSAYAFATFEGKRLAASLECTPVPSVAAAAAVLTTRYGRLVLSSLRGGDVKAQ